MLLTIFTPTYNRASLLSQVYASLCAQTNKDFEWLVVDDGSADHTEEVVRGFIEEHIISVRYLKKTNGGKHTAINLGVKEAKGQLFWILDSDDRLPAIAVETLLKYIACLEDPTIGGICGYMAHHDGTVIGNPVVSQPVALSSVEMRYQVGITGDMMEVFRTSVLAEFPFPEIKNERFCPEVLVWNRIAQHYKLYLIPDVIYSRDYLAGGLTSTIVNIRMKSPIASMMTYSELFDLTVPFKQKLKAAINYWRFSFCASRRGVGIASWGKLLAPIGWLMHLYDKRRAGR
ncbi:MAG: glycosyltransferase family 2 protein [Bacteroidaceae bacterium]|nr:glycosyltransferase family 2 protein [Bacteroidaceae bacterium]